MYYVFNRKPLLTGRWIGEGPYIEDIDFDVGQYINEKDVKTPIKYTLEEINNNSEDHGPYLPAYMYDAYPLFREDLVTALRECGVDNLQVFNAIVHDSENGAKYTNYKAVNVVGLMAVADMEKSVATVHQGSALIDVEFDKLVIDEKKARGAFMFRLAEATSTILVHERVRDCLIRKGFDKDLAFFEPGDVAA